MIIVKITSVKLKSFWYSKKIGKEYLVYRSEKFKDKFKVIDPPKEELTNPREIGLYISEEDCEIIKT